MLKYIVYRCFKLIGNRNININIDRMVIIVKSYVLEVCVDSVESAIAAVKGGATRLELCSDLIIGGTTPTLELFYMVREKTGLPIHVLIRPRFGDFLYSEYEYELMCRQIKSFAEAGAAGVVIGSLNADGTLNEEQMSGMIRAAGNMKITLHRAFDVTQAPFEVLEAARGLGVDIILTSGQCQSCHEGKELIKDLLAKSGDMDILIGGGVNTEVIESFIRETEARNFHMSGKEVLESDMKYRNTGVNMGLPGISEFEILRTSEQQILKAVRVLEKFC